MRTKITTPARPAIETREELERAAGQAAALLIQRDGLAAQMDAEIQKVRERFEGQLTHIDAATKPLIADLHEWAETHRLIDFADKRSMDLLHAVIGFRTGMPKLVLKRGVKWSTVLDMLKVRLEGRYVRVREDIDKERLLADRETLGRDKLASLGMEVVQDESFFIDPKREELPAAAGAR